MLPLFKETQRQSFVFTVKLLSESKSIFKLKESVNQGKPIAKVLLFELEQFVHQNNSKTIAKVLLFELEQFVHQNKSKTIAKVLLFELEQFVHQNKAIWKHQRNIWNT